MIGGDSRPILRGFQVPDHSRWLHFCSLLGSDFGGKWFFLTLIAELSACGVRMVPGVYVCAMRHRSQSVQKCSRCRVRMSSLLASSLRICELVPCDPDAGIGVPRPRGATSCADVGVHRSPISDDSGGRAHRAVNAAGHARISRPKQWVDERMDGWTDEPQFAAPGFARAVDCPLISDKYPVDWTCVLSVEGLARVRPSLGIEALSAGAGLGEQEFDLQVMASEHLECE